MKLPQVDSEGDTRGNMRKSRSVLTVSPNNVSQHDPSVSHQQSVYTRDTVCVITGDEVSFYCV